MRLKAFTYEKTVVYATKIWPHLRQKNPWHMQNIRIHDYRTDT